MTALPIVETQEGDVSAYIPTNVISLPEYQPVVPIPGAIAWPRMRSLTPLGTPSSCNEYGSCITQRSHCRLRYACLVLLGIPAAHILGPLAMPLRVPSVS